MPTKAPSEKNMAANLVEITLRLIDKSGGLAGLNLRQIAREAGCAHTNVYNYFPSFDALVLAALKALLVQLIGFTKERIGPERVGKESSLEDFLAAQVDFALEHPGWYRFMWFGDIEGSRSDAEIMKVFSYLATTFNEEVFLHFKGAMTRGHADEVGDILHGLLHGEICKLIGGRAIDFEKERYRAKIAAECRSLLEAFKPHAED